MKPKELIALARSLDEDCDCLSYGFLVSYILDTVKEDDDEQITKEWFVEQCKNEEHDFLYVKDNMWLEYRHGTITLEGNTDSHNFDHIKTRGQLRKLLEVLGGGK